MATFVRAKDQKWKDRETSNKVWIENPNHKLKSERKVPVVYYLTRNGQLEHPHFMEVTLSSPDDGLYLRDVINRLNFLRGKGIASLYSWSAKRSYRNGFVWHDLADHDFIYPAHGQEYVLKGSQLVEGATTLTSKNQVSEVRKLSEFPAVSRRRNQSWCSADFHEYRVYKAESSSNEYSGKAAADASTQTDDRRRRRREIGIAEEEDYQSTELSISPPPSDSSPETLETLMKADGKVIVRPETDETAHNNESNGKSRGSSVLMQLLSCGSMSFKDCGPGGYGKDHGLSLISHYKSRVPRGPGLHSVAEISSRVEHQGMTKLEDTEEYLNGSLIETNKDEYPALKRSSSWNADRSAKLEIREKEIEGVRAKCIPRRPKNQSSRKELGSSIDLSCVSSGASISSSSSSQHGSKRLVVPPQL
ncbi:hypothetical protein EJD97_021291 [Solanum chilense]|uniref:SOSEKI DIX-like domain-containing protein n=1 Tax=Solanum chilense TaxID=4083 RepID=A0A6N2AVN4_SOLCI|nr:hypothetical protein EJD97_021291 [Solanum chilense]